MHDRFHKPIFCDPYRLCPYTKLSYVYRENVVLSIIGSLAGLLLGKVLHGYIMNVIEMDDVIFPKIIFGQSYVFAVLITVVFGILVNYSMYRKLKNIPMVESLKSVE